MLDELYWARRGGGAFLNGRRIRVSGCRRLDAALLCTGFSYNLDWRRTNLVYFAEFVMKAQAIRREVALQDPSRYTIDARDLAAKK